MHSHALSAVLAADLAGSSDHVVFQGLEMLKGLRGGSNLDKHPVPVIQNTTRESDLVQQVDEVVDRSDFAGSYAILVQNHGAYIWGEDVWETKRHAEVYHFLFEATVARVQRHPRGG
jgi:ribulose-5-phosphate 4-epimerase/fuculose-1-phosphate aldolase